MVAGTSGSFPRHHVRLLAERVCHEDGFLASRELWSGRHLALGSCPVSVEPAPGVRALSPETCESALVLWVTQTLEDTFGVAAVVDGIHDDGTDYSGPIATVEPLGVTTSEKAIELRRQVPRPPRLARLDPFRSGCQLHMARDCVCHESSPRGAAWTSPLSQSCSSRELLLMPVLTTWLRPHRQFPSLSTEI